MAAEDILAEGLARLEYKVDILLRQLIGAITTPMSFPGQTCPACTSFIDYQIDVAKGVVVRKCKCSTGKVPPMIPLMPVAADPAAKASTDDQMAQVLEAINNRQNSKVK